MVDTRADLERRRYKWTVSSSCLSSYRAPTLGLAFIASASLPVLSACRKEPGSGPANVAEAGPVERPKGPLSREDAERYVLALVNHDRAEAGLPAVEWDATAARAGAGHVEDMTRQGYTGHWGTDGSVPEQRYTDAGGTHMVQENAACFFDGVVRDLDPAPTFTAVDLEKIEGAFMAEVPPHDGHKKNILKPWHNKLGVAVEKPRGVAQACLVEEFVDEYGSYEALPRKASVGQTVHVSGEVDAPVKFGAVGVARIDPARSLSAAEINARSTYPIPDPYVLYSPAGFVTPKPVHVEGNRFSIDVPLSDKGRPGRYEISVWGLYPGSGASLAMIGLRVIDVK